MESFLHYFDISLERANQFYTWGWRLSVSAALVTLLGVALLWWGTRIRDRDSEQKIASLNLEAAQLRQNISWRRLTKQQHDKIVESLKVSPKQTINVEYNSTDPEVTVYAFDLMKSFSDGGANVTHTAVQIVGTIPEFGVGLHTRTVREVGEVIKALSAGQVEYELRPPYPQSQPGFPQMHNPGVQVFVGTKPAPF